MLELHELCTGYGRQEILHNISLSFPAGQVSVLLGPNGCGKSTLLKTMCGLLPLRHGSVTLDSVPLDVLPQKQLAQKVAYLAQSRQVPDITVQRMVLHGRFPYLSYPRRYRQQDRRTADAAMDAMGLTALADAPLSTLSGGQRQKVYLAMALAQDTPVVLLDEPTTYLDAAHQLQMMQEARALAAAGKTIVMVLHDLPLALRHADHAALLCSGQVAAEGSAEELFSSGILNTVFGVRLGRTQTLTGWHYYLDSL